MIGDVVNDMDSKLVGYYRGGLHCVGSVLELLVMCDINDIDIVDGVGSDTVDDVGYW